MAQPSLPSAIRRIQATRRRPSTRLSQGISLTELLIGVVISIIVLGAAVRALVSLIRGDSTTQVELNRKDDVSRVLGLMQDEIRNAQRVETGASLSPLSGCNTTPLLILRGATADEDISYGLRIQTSNTTWRGPTVLARCGPDYTTNPISNQPELNSTAGRREQEVLDSIATSGFTASTLGGSGDISRSVQLSLISSASGTALTNTVQVPIGNNQVYSLASNRNSGNCSTGCLDANGGSIHYTPALGSTNISGSTTLEDVFYFNLNRSDYTLSDTPGRGLCTRTRCTVILGSAGSSITFTQGDVLVFKDIQIRL